MVRPTFLGIGAARSGTTWTSRMLEAHPEVFLPPQVKEVHYFDREVRHRPWEWYLSHFAAAGDMTARGEFTPEYARLRPELVREIARLLPDLRLVFVIRHPVERTMSQLRNFTLVRRPHAHAGYLLRHVVDRRESRRRNDYAATIRTWTEAFGPDSLLVVLYDDLVQDPRAALAPVFGHLGVDPDWSPAADLVEAEVSVRSGRPERVPDEELVRWYLARMWLEPTRELDQLLGGRVSHWVDDMEQAAEAPLSWRAYRQARRLLLFPPWDVAYQARDQWRARQLLTAVAAIHTPAAAPPPGGAA